MLRRCAASLAVLSVLYGLSAAPFTHAHHTIGSVSDERHPHGESLVHTHASPHTHNDGHDPSRPEGEGDHDGGEQIWSVETFVFQPAGPAQAPAPALVILGEPQVRLTSTRLGAHRPQPKAHGPPIGSSSGLRAPPALPPVFA